MFLVINRHTKTAKTLIYSADDENELRFVLVQKGKNILLVIGVNPSTAYKEKAKQSYQGCENGCTLSGVFT